MAMTGTSMWARRKAAIAGVEPYQGSDPVALAAYRDAIGIADSNAIIAEIVANAVVSVTSVAGVTPGGGSSGSGSGTISS